MSKSRESFHSHGRRGGGGGCNPCGCCCGCLFNCFLSCICQILCTLLVIAGVVAAVLWLVFRPNALRFYVDDATLTQFDYSASGKTLRYNLAASISIRNPNKRIGVYYDTIEARALYDNQRFDAVNLDPFFQGTKNTSNLQSTFKGQNSLPLRDDSKYSEQKRNGAYEIDLKLYLKIRLKFWFIKSKTFKCTINCNLEKVPLVSNGTSPGNFERTTCHLDW
ncbi:unnamed protein product [Cuscuta campestris]|uniref:Late embryogenesis abundant protein LEA-2 subgroup domain-containing protein n=2 Tax=Cuscuta sect. Cleistogrammica TaxID=1824901 RepID=A0A484LCX7_9ASTE|nr:hypothetical protein DM860_010455 [Cuscuta australis]VFQ74164.1 unnamed protein product [Cuscuta campestris]